ncbi:hypothetical protein M0R72_01570 [Candidatus Pacearchaeota archaeon]|jgi:hypothetical protein|nr:hypothetical protein [Candidatus Pacearchaeota archaeon]
MNYINSINYESVDAQTIGIIIVIPVTGMEKRPFIATYHKCEGCERQAQYENFCSKCGGKIIEVTEKVKYHNSYQMEDVPIPDVRQEMNDLGIENHLPFNEDQEDMVWKFVFKCYATIGDRSYHVPFIEELDLKQIHSDLEEAKEKFKEVLEKYNGKVVFGIAGDFADW